MTNLISASRRTDIPRYFARWFAERRQAGFAEYRNAFGVAGRVSLHDEDVLGFLFWTRDAAPFDDQLRALRDAGLPYAFQYTLIGYGREIDQHVPRPARAIAEFGRVSQDLPAPTCIQWRYDPIVLSERYTAAWHRENFRSLAKELRGMTHVVNTSFVEPYLKALRRMPGQAVRYRSPDPRRHRTVAARYPDLPGVSADGQALLDELAAIAWEHDMELRACCNPEWELPPSACGGPELFAPYGERVARPALALPRAPSRDGCRCPKMIDIGMDNTCLAGCRYCYVVSSHEAAVRNFKKHEPRSPGLR